MRSAFYILFIVLLLALSGCRSSKETGEKYVESTKEEVLQESTMSESEIGGKNTLEESEKNTREETNKKTSAEETEIEYYPPTADNPQGGAKKSEKKTTIITDEQAVKKSVEKAVKETTERYEKLLTEQKSITAIKDKEIESLRSELSKVDSRLIQGSDWLFVSGGIVLGLVVAGFLLYLYIKKNKKKK